MSYLTHAGVRDPADDIALHDRLVRSGHMSPFEHVAKPSSFSEQAIFGSYSGNFRGWHQYRKDISGENDFSQLQDL